MSTIATIHKSAADLDSEISKLEGLEEDVLEGIRDASQELLQAIAEAPRPGQQTVKSLGSTTAILD